MEAQKKRCWAEISLANIEHNYRQLRSKLPKECKFLGVVKANAYGHGAVQVAGLLENAGADYLAVAFIDEAIELRRHGISLPILVLGYTFPEYTAELIEYDITQAVGSVESGMEYARIAGSLGKPLKCHLKIDSGMGRTGAMFAWQGYGVQPDIMTAAKALGCGVPVGAFLLNEKAASASLVPGDHGTTYGGNPFATAAVSVVYDLYEELKIVDHVKEIGTYLYDELEKMTTKYECIKAHRGIGLMQGLEFDRPVGPVVKKALENGLVIISAGANIIRFVPPLVIEKEHVDEMVRVLSKVIEELI